MRKVFLILCFFDLVFAVFAFSEEAKFEVFTVNPDKKSFMIKTEQGKEVAVGDEISVRRAKREIAKATIAEVRSTTVVAEILSIKKGQEIKVGDETLIVKKKKRPIKKPKEAKKPKPIKEPKKPAWTPILGVASDQKQLDTAGLEVGPKKRILSTTYSIDINNKKNIVFSYALQVLRENGYLIISSNRLTGIILVNKPIALSLVSELWADAVAAIDHNIVISFNFKERGGLTELSAISFKEYFRKGKQIKIYARKGSAYYKELTDVVSKIKERSEY